MTKGTHTHTQMHIYTSTCSILSVSLEVFNYLEILLYRVINYLEILLYRIIEFVLILESYDFESQY